MSRNDHHRHDVSSFLARDRDRRSVPRRFAAVPASLALLLVALWLSPAVPAAHAWSFAPWGVELALAGCGDGLIIGEQCDDQNTDDGDGCSSSCEIESGWSCDFEPSECSSQCDDGVVVGDEECDDGNGAGGDGCSSSCTVEAGWLCAGEPSACAPDCGDGAIVGDEQCDDGGTQAGDGCSAACALEPGWSCGGEPTSCDEQCSDGLIVGDEVCDDANAAGGDGCSAGCAVESGWLCAGEPTVCAPDCGDGMIVGDEQCDDGNTIDGDGCSSACACEGGCGDGFLNGVPGCAVECCDHGEGNGIAGGSCTSSCECVGSCTLSAAECSAAIECGPGEGCCGNGIAEAGEACDDGNVYAGDCCSPSCTIEPDCVAPCPGVPGPHMMPPAQMKAKFKDKDGDGSYESWLVGRKGAAGDLLLLRGQSVDCSTETVTVSVFEGDGGGGLVTLGEFAVAPGDWTATPIKDGEESCKLKDTTEMRSDPAGVATAHVKEKDAKVRYVFKGKGQASIQQATGDPVRLRTCIAIGDHAGTAVLDCEVKRDGALMKCAPPK